MKGETMYTGKIINEGEIKDVDRIVRRHGEHKKIDSRYDLANHSPRGFCWGYGGSGPAQLALAILCDYLKDDTRARRMYQAFKSEVIARLPMDENFVLTDRQIEDFITVWEVQEVRRG